MVERMGKMNLDGLDDKSAVSTSRNHVFDDSS